MKNWVVTVKRRGDPQRRRIFVEDIEYADEAERLALLKLGADSPDYESQAEPIHDRVSIEKPNDNLQEVYEQTVTALDDLQEECQKLRSIAAEYLERAETAEDERDSLLRTNIFVLSNLTLIKTTVDKLHTVIQLKGENADN